MRQSRTSGSVEGAVGDRRPYSDHPPPGAGRGHSNVGGLLAPTPNERGDGGSP